MLKYSRKASVKVAGDTAETWTRHLINTGVLLSS